MGARHRSPATLRQARLNLFRHALFSKATLSARRQFNDLKPTFIHRGQARSKPLPLLLQFFHPSAINGSRHSPSYPKADLLAAREHT
jgi:hypothetical protein